MYKGQLLIKDGANSSFFSGHHTKGESNMGTISVNRLAGLSLIFGPIIAFIFFS